MAGDGLRRDGGPREDGGLTSDRAIEDLLRELAPQVLGALVRRMGHFDAAEDAVQEALLSAAVRWRHDGIPEQPRGWLFTVAFRRLTDQLRSAQSRRRREEAVFAALPADQRVAAPVDAVDPAGDDTLILLFLCAHPDLTDASQIALTLRAVGGLTTAEIARAFMVPEATMGQRISRAKQRIKTGGATFRMPPPQQLGPRLATVLHVLYLIFNEGYTATSGTSLQRQDLAAEAIRLARLLHRLLPEDSEVTGLLALMLLTEARRDARTGNDGELVPLAEQDRRRWDRRGIAEGITLVEAAFRAGPTGPYQLQAAIAALHDDAPSHAATDWPQVRALYSVLDRLVDNPVVSLNHAIAHAMVDGPQAGLARLDDLARDPLLASTHRLDAARAHLLEQTGEHDAAVRHYLAAARLTQSQPEQRYLMARAARLSSLS